MCELAMGRRIVFLALSAMLFMPFSTYAEYKPDIAKLSAKAENGDARAQYLLANCYFVGNGVPEDRKQAVIWYREAAKRGYAFAQGSLGWCYENAEGAPKNMKQAAEWYRKAAEQGDDLWQFCLGKLYATGKGISEDTEQAAKWYRKAAEQGNALAQRDLGILYANGEGVPKDFVQAYMWLNLAATKGTEKAAEGRSKVEQKMTLDQIAQAQRLSAAFSPETVKKDALFEDFFAPRKKTGGIPLIPEEVAGFIPLASPSSESPTKPSHDNLVLSATGFFVTTDGWLVTNAHVATAGSKAMVKWRDKVYSAAVKKVDAANDLALIKVEGQFTNLAVERAGGVALGTSVFTVGFPNPSLQGFSPKMTKGEISSLAGVKDDPRYFQISAPIQPGSSGGALADASGNVVGVVSAMISDMAAIETAGAIPQNVNYAVKSTYLLALIESVPDAAKGMRGPAVKTQDFAAAVQGVERASAMVLMFE